MTNYKTLEAWKKSMNIVKEVYELTKKFPKEEMYALTSQMKRSSVSIPSNIAEGVGRNYKKDTIQYLHISRGSLYELDTQLNIAVLVNIVSQEAILHISNLIEESKKILNGLIGYYEKNHLK